VDTHPSELQDFEEYKRENLYFKKLFEGSDKKDGYEIKYYLLQEKNGTGILTVKGFLKRGAGFFLVLVLKMAVRRVSHLIKNIM